MTCISLFVDIHLDLKTSNLNNECSQGLFWVLLLLSVKLLQGVLDFSDLV